MPQKALNFMGAKFWQKRLAKKVWQKSLAKKFGKKLLAKMLMKSTSEVQLIVLKSFGRNAPVISSLKLLNHLFSDLYPQIGLFSSWLIINYTIKEKSGGNPINLFIKNAELVSKF